MKTSLKIIGGLLMLLSPALVYAQTSINCTMCGEGLTGCAYGPANNPSPLDWIGPNAFSFKKYKIHAAVSEDADRKLFAVMQVYYADSFNSPVLVADKQVPFDGKSAELRGSHRGIASYSFYCHFE